VEPDEHPQSHSEKKMNLNDLVESYKQKLESEPDNSVVQLNLGMAYASLNIIPFH